MDCSYIAKLLCALMALTVPTCGELLADEISIAPTWTVPQASGHSPSAAALNAVPLENPLPPAVPGGVQVLDTAQSPEPDSGEFNLSPSPMVQSFAAVINTPCYFPRTPQLPYQATTIRQSLHVYEGMRLTLRTDGAYEVAYEALVPATHVTVNLSLQIMTPDGLRRTTLTLPPVTILNDAGLNRNVSGRTVPVRQTGYSHALKTLTVAATPKKDGQSSPPTFVPLVITRSGKATFGTVPPQAKYVLSSSASED